MNQPSLDELITAGVHFGHRSSRWNPKMKPFIFTTRNKIHVIDLEETLTRLERALDYVKDLASRGETLLFIGTKRQAKDIVKKAAQSCDMPFVTVRWLGGTFTNYKTIQKTVRKLKELHQSKESKDFEQKYTKKERLTIEREIVKLENLFEGIKSMKKLPEAIYVLDVNHEKIAVTEAGIAGVKVVGLVDTNVDPDLVDYIIPGNDDAIKSIDLITKLVAEAVNEGHRLGRDPAESGEKASPKTAVLEKDPSTQPESGQAEKGNEIKKNNEDGKKDSA